MSTIIHPMLEALTKGSVWLQTANSTYQLVPEGVKLKVFRVKTKDPERQIGKVMVGSYWSVISSGSNDCLQIIGDKILRTVIRQWSEDWETAETW